MMQRRSLRSFETAVIILTLAVVSVGIYRVDKARAQNFVRQVVRSPSGYRLWFVTTDGNHVFAIDIAPVDPKRWELLAPNPIVPPFHFLQIDPTTEQVVKEGKTNHIFAQAIVAEQEQTHLSWLAKDHGYWVVDHQNNVAFALITLSVDSPRIDVIDLSTREVKRTIRLQPEANYGAMALHPNGTKLYLSVREIEVGGLVWVYDTKTLERIKVIQLDCDHTIKDIHFSKDGQYLFGAVGSRGVAIIETRDDKIVGWINPPSDRLFKSPMALSSDEQEIYIGLEYGLKKGAVAAIDVAQKKIVRVLELSLTGCTGVALVGNKLFAACLDGVYVIDIPVWRKQQR